MVLDRTDLTASKALLQGTEQRVAFGQNNTDAPPWGKDGRVWLDAQRSLVSRDKSSLFLNSGVPNQANGIEVNVVVGGGLGVR